MSDEKYHWEEILDSIVAEHGNEQLVEVFSPGGAMDTMPAKQAAAFIYDRYDHFDWPSCGVSIYTEEVHDKLIHSAAEYDRRVNGWPSEWQRYASSPDVEEHEREETMCNKCLGTGENGTGGMCTQCQGSGFSK